MQHIGQPSMDTTPQSLPLVVEPSKEETFTGPQQNNVLFGGLGAYLASVAIGVTMMRRRIVVIPNKLRHGAAGRLFVGMLPGRAGVLTMMVKDTFEEKDTRPALAPLARVPTDAITMADGKPNVRLLSKIEKLEVLAGLAESGLLSGLEEDGAFSTLERLGAFSFIESTLPIVQKLGILSFLQSTLEVPAGLLFGVATLLIAVGPGFATLVSNEIVPGPEGPLFAASVAGFGLTTVLGAVLFAWAFAVSKLQEA